MLIRRHCHIIFADLTVRFFTILIQFQHWSIKDQALLLFERVTGSEFGESSFDKQVDRLQIYKVVIELFIVGKYVVRNCLDEGETDVVAEADVSVLGPQNDGLIYMINYDLETHLDHCKLTQLTV